jgi:hypothetical protein
LIPHDEISTLGFGYLTSLVDAAFDRFPHEEEKLNQFFEYFIRTWIQTIKPNDWNIHRQIAEGELIANRTNNPLESYNNRCNNLFPTAHPSLAVFVDVLRKDAESFVQQIHEINQGISTAPDHAPSVVPTLALIPNQFTQYRQAWYCQVPEESEAHSLSSKSVFFIDEYALNIL